LSPAEDPLRPDLPQMGGRFRSGAGEEFGIYVGRGLIRQLDRC
jgi:hypothetical protein